jgi:hypothetical protein
MQQVCDTVDICDVGGRVKSQTEGVPGNPYNLWYISLLEPLRSTVSHRQESIALFEYWYSGRVERVPKTAPQNRRFLPPFHRYVPFICG